MNELFFACLALNGVGLILLGVGVRKLHEAIAADVECLTKEVSSIRRHLIDSSRAMVELPEPPVARVVRHNK